MNLLEYLLMQRHIWATLSLLWGIAYLLFLTMWRSRMPKISWILNVEPAVFLIVMGVLHWLDLYGVDTKIARSLAIWAFYFAVLATFAAFLVSKLRGSGRG